MICSNVQYFTLPNNNFDIANPAKYNKTLNGQWITLISPIVNVFSNITFENGSKFPLNLNQSIFVPNNETITIELYPIIYNISSDIDVDSTGKSQYVFMISDDQLNNDINSVPSYVPDSLQPNKWEMQLSFNADPLLNDVLFHIGLCHCSRKIVASLVQSAGAGSLSIGYRERTDLKNSVIRQPVQTWHTNQYLAANYFDSRCWINPKHEIIAECFDIYSTIYGTVDINLVV